jgi:hypothetical protein
MIKMEETKKDVKVEKVNSGRIWIFRFLVLVVAALLLYVWFNPWWSIDIEGFGDDMVQIRPWGLEMNERMGGFAIFLKGAQMPPWFGPAMWTFLGLCLLALLIGMFVKGINLGIGKIRMSLSQFLIGGVGLAFLAAGVVMAVYAAMRMKAMMDVPLVGTGYIDLGDPLIANVYTRLTPAYYLIYVVAVALLLLAIFRNKIAGEK